MKNAKIILSIVLTVSLFIFSCKKDKSPEVVATNDSTNTTSTNDSTSVGGNEDSTVTFLTLLDNISVSDSTITYDSLFYTQNLLSGVNVSQPTSGIDILFGNNGGMSASSWNTTGYYTNKMTGIRIYNQSISGYELYNLDATQPHSFYNNLPNSNGVTFEGTFVNSNGDVVTIPSIALSFQ